MLLDFTINIEINDESKKVWVKAEVLPPEPGYGYHPDDPGSVYVISVFDASSTDVDFDAEHEKIILDEAWRYFESERDAALINQYEARHDLDRDIY